MKFLLRLNFILQINLYLLLSKVDNSLQNTVIQLWHEVTELKNQWTIFLSNLK